MADVRIHPCINKTNPCWLARQSWVLGEDNIMCRNKTCSQKKKNRKPFSIELLDLFSAVNSTEHYAFNKNHLISLTISSSMCNWSAILGYLNLSFYWSSYEFVILFGFPCHRLQYMLDLCIFLQLFKTAVLFFSFPCQPPRGTALVPNHLRFLYSFHSYWMKSAPRIISFWRLKKLCIFLYAKIQAWGYSDKNTSIHGSRRGQLSVPTSCLLNLFQNAGKPPDQIFKWHRGPWEAAENQANWNILEQYRILAEDLYHAPAQNSACLNSMKSKHCILCCTLAYIDISPWSLPRFQRCTQSIVNLSL